jgi:hypothetical protein
MWRSRGESAGHELPRPQGAKVYRNSVHKRAGEPRETRSGALIPRPKYVEKYYNACGAVDIWNHFRQGGESLEDVWNTMDWRHRIFAILVEMMEANAFCTYAYFKDPALTHLSGLSPGDD